MKLNIEMHDPAGHLLEELAMPGITQDSVAITYAYCIAQLGNKADWPALNAAIAQRWKSRTALVRVKEKAWKHVERWMACGEAGG